MPSCHGDQGLAENFGRSPMQCRVGQDLPSQAQVMFLKENANLHFFETDFRDAFH